MARLVFFVLACFFPSSLQAAPCCAANGAIPSLITTDHRFQSSMGFTSSKVYGFLNAKKEIRERAEKMMGSQLDVSWLLSDYWQMGFGMPFLYKSIEKQAFFGVGDIKVHGAYEVLPELFYSAWKPRGYLFFQGILPTGVSTHSAIQPKNVDAVGEGRYSLVLGSVFFKTIRQWDIYGLFEWIHSFPASYEDGQKRLGVLNKLGCLLGVGFHFRDWRFGVQVDPVYQQAFETQRLGKKTTTSARLTTSLGLDVSYKIDASWAVRMSVQVPITFLASNTNLIQRLGVGVFYRLPQ